LVVGLSIVAILLLIASFAPLLAPPQQEARYQLPRDGISRVPVPPSSAHPLGTLPGQYDVYYGLIWGTRVAFRVSLSVMLGRALVGTLVGLIAGYMGRFIDGVLMRLTDAFMAFPIMAAAMVMLALFGSSREQAIRTGNPQAVWNQLNSIVIAATIVFGWMQYARLVRGNVLVERGKAYVESAVSLGASRWRILFRHLLPNATDGLLVLMASDVGAILVLVSAFHFIGLTLVPGGELSADWGQMLSVSRDWIVGTPASAFEYWYTYLVPSGAILLFSVGWNLVGDGLRELLDPHRR